MIKISITFEEFKENDKPYVTLTQLLRLNNLHLQEYQCLFTNRGHARDCYIQDCVGRIENSD